ncbi:MAG TPA: hypothetical protein VED18_05875 [Candidatus Sulfotelmatobacter sp.]|nr:hypothetical protein [Candidatus Sulfotelmatobacter sp.]
MHGTVGQGRRLGAALGVAWCVLAGGPGLSAAAEGSGAPPPGAGAAFQNLPREALHQVERGQDLHLIAGYYYGDARQWERIWQANRDVVKNPNRLSVGMALRIPLDPDWKQDLSYDEWLKGGGGARPAAPAPPPAGRRGAAPASPQGAAAAAGEALPPPAGPVSLLYKPAKGFAQTLRFAITGKMVAAGKGQTRPMDVDQGGRLRQVVEEVGADGTVRQALTLLDHRGADFSPANFGLPGLGETLRQEVNPLGKVVRVEGKEPGSVYYLSPFVYPDAPLGVGGSWQVRQQYRADDGTEVVEAGSCTLVRRERLRGEEGFRVQCQGSQTSGAGGRAQMSGTSTTTAVVRVRDGTLMHMEQRGQSSGQVPGQDVTISMDVRIVMDEEAPAPGTAAR